MAHQYTVEELNKEYGEVWQEIRNVNDYHVLYEIKNNGNNKYVVIGCSNMLHALKYISSNYYEMLKEKFTTQQLQEWENAINNAITSIKNEKSDENVDFKVLNIETEENRILIDYAGYWDNFARTTPTLIYFGTAIEYIERMHIATDAKDEKHNERMTEVTEVIELMEKLNLLRDYKINKGIEVFDENAKLIDLELKELEENIKRRNIILGENENDDGEFIIMDDNIEQLNKQIDKSEIMIDKLKLMIGNDVDIYSPEFMINFNNICKEICEQESNDI